MGFNLGQKIIDFIRKKQKVPVCMCTSDQIENKSEILNLENVKKWFLDDGDKTLRLNYDLNENSLVFDVGGYKGSFTADIFIRYGCNIHIFEPMQEFIEIMDSKYSKNKKIRINPFGLSNKDAVLEMTCNDDGSSFFNSNSTLKKQSAKVVDICKYMDENRINHVDLVKINIEGGEYDLLEQMIKCNLITRFDNIQVQFHNVSPDSKDRMKKIQEELSKTHYLTYQYQMVWENWAKKQ